MTAAVADPANHHTVRRIRTQHSTSTPGLIHTHCTCTHTHTYRFNRGPVPGPGCHSVCGGPGRARLLLHHTPAAANARKLPQSHHRWLRVCADLVPNHIPPGESQVSDSYNSYNTIVRTCCIIMLSSCVVYSLKAWTASQLSVNSEYSAWTAQHSSWAQD